MNRKAQQSLRSHLGLTVKWDKIRNGWYVTIVAPNERYVHIRRCDDDNPKWGWDVFSSDNRHSFERHAMIGAGIATLWEAKEHALEIVQGWKTRG